MAELNPNPEIPTGPVTMQDPASLAVGAGTAAPAVPPTGLARFGVHVEHAWFGLGFGMLAAFLGYVVAPSGAEVPSAIVVGAFAAAIVLWAPTLTWLRAGLALLALALLAVRTFPDFGVFAFPVALAVATSPGRTTLRWLAHAVGVGVVTGAAALVVAKSPEAELAAIFVGVVAVAALSFSAWLAGGRVHGRR